MGLVAPGFPLDLHLRDVHLHKILETTIDGLRPAAEAQGVQVWSTLDASAPLLPADPDRLRQVFEDVLASALQGTPRGGQLTVSTQRRNSHIDITIRAKPRKQGAPGLELSIARHLVALHGGTLLEEHQDKGSAWVITLPVVPLSLGAVPPPAGQDVWSASRAQATHAPDALRGVDILLVEDNADARELLATLLTSAGARVALAASAPEALAYLLDHQPDVLVADIGLPGQDGYTLLEQVRSRESQQPAPRALPAIALTAYTCFEDRLRAFAAGYQLHLGKPVEAADLINAVKLVAVPRD
jgi:CheY-like chemotaxis protein